MRPISESQEKGKEKLNSLRNFFSKVGKGVERTGKVTSEAPKRIRRPSREETTPEEDSPDLSTRLQELKRLETETPRMGLVPEWEEEEEEWEERRVELGQPLSDRLADVFSGPFKGPASRLSGFFSSLDEDLNRANMRISAERYLTFLLGIGSIVGISALLFSWLLIGSLFLSLLAGPGGFFLSVVFGRIRPKSRIKSRATQINQEIPYALRHMATQLASGIGLPETMISVARAKYGPLSEEFRRALRDMRTGESMVKALTTMRDRVGSDSLTRAIRQIQRTLRTGGNLSRTLKILADESAFDLRMNLRDYTQRLNMMAMVYMFASAVIPPLLIVVMIVGKFMGGMVFSSEMVTVLYLGAIPFLLFYMVIIFKRMEPEV